MRILKKFDLYKIKSFAAESHWRRAEVSPPYGVGTTIGRPFCKKISILKKTLDDAKKKEEYKEVLKLLKACYPIRKVAKLTDVSESTVKRLKREFCI